MRLFLAILFTVGLLLVCFPIVAIVNAPSTEEIKKERAYIATWPVASGLLDEVHIRQSLHTARGYLWFYVDVSYRYTVDGQEYVGTRLGIQEYRDTSPEKLEARMERLMSYSHVVKQEEAEDGPIGRRKRFSFFLVDQPVDVHYDPHNPASSILDTQDYDPPRVLHAVLPALGLGLVGMIIMAVCIVRWRELNSAGQPTVQVQGWATRKTRAPQREVPRRVKPHPSPPSDDWLSLQRRGESFLRSGEYEKALDAFDRALVVAPGEAGTRHSEISILLRKGECLMEIERREDALRCLDEALRRAKSGPGTEALTAEAERLKEKLAEMQTKTNATCISPWADHVELASPDGKTTAVIHDAMEIAMGAPTSGTLRLSSGLTRNHCNPSMVWSSDSEYLAAPQWTQTMNQRLMIISLSRRLHRYASGQYRVLQLESFDNGVIRGIDSPAHLPAPIQVDISKIDWSDG
jgi:tetratricopeptide (TPR) repeat protein